FEEGIREAVAHQLLIPDGTQGYAFRHALIREAIYGDLLPGERTRLHGRFAELLADPGRLASVPGTAAELAHHCLASHDITGAFTASVQAAQEAERLAATARRRRAGAVGTGQGAGQARGDGPRDARVPLGNQRGGQRRGRARGP